MGPPEPQANGAFACGYFWSPPAVLAGKSQSEYFEDVGVCTYKYAHGGSEGQQGGYLLKCTIPSGFAFALGQTQSALCEAADGSNYTVGPTAALQMNIDPASLSSCEYCKIQDVDGAYPDVLECDGTWTPTSCPAQSSAFLNYGSEEGGTVCGEARAAPNGEIPMDVLPQHYGLLDDSNQGADPDQYQDICFGPYNASSRVKAPGYGGFSNFAVAQCDNADGCTVYRVFDIPPEPQANGAFACGYFWSPPAVLAGKSQSEYFEDVGVCTYKYAHGGSDGQQGGYLLKCTIPSGFAFAIGQTQSALCEAADGSNYTVGPTTALQMNIDPASLSSCEYCKIKNVDGAYPDVLECDGSWTSMSCSN